jgi:hypothetical protein
MKTKCVLCGCDVEVPEHCIDDRYIEGAGQLCTGCYYDVYIDPCKKQRLAEHLKRIEAEDEFVKF